MNRITVNPDRSIGTINRNIYGHFSEHLGRCIYGGIYVGPDSPIPNVNGMRTDVVNALKAIRIPVLRWPGGCFADEYHWQDGIGPKDQRKRMVNTNWGHVVEDNSFGTHEFLELCRQLECEPYINANVGSGTVREMAEWVEYLNSPGDSSVVRQRWANGQKEPWGVKLWGVGNESWGCGGNMRPEYYADEFRRYQTYCRDYPGTKLYRIACGPNTDDYRWSEVLMERAGRFMDGLTMHYYSTTGPTWEQKGKALSFDTAQFYELLAKAARMEEFVIGHSRIMDKYDPERRVGLIVDEWGSWHQVEEGTNPGFLYQQNTMRDALVAAIHLNLFNRHCDRVVMANLAQTVNVLQSVVLTDGERMVLTPTWHVFDLFKAHQGAKAADCFVECDRVGEGAWQVDRISASASEKDGAVTLTAANCAMDEATQLRVRVLGRRADGEARARILTAEAHAFNSFGDSPVSAKEFTGFTASAHFIDLELPPCSVIELTLA
ncbi:MAG: alpha-N-arabinofuranosidase [Clostridia bacterium]|nr:alpha-N-arabinofuranosidase [Clostridia bacterium]